MSSSSSRNLDPAESRYDPNPKWIYDVFLSFCGKDTGKSFASDLKTALINAGVSVFREENDDQLRSEEQITLSVLDAIEGSRTSIIVFSTNYADSRRCLQELVKITECHKTKGQRVVPVLYDVYPSDVGNRTLTGMFGEAFKRRRLKQIALMENWRATLTDASFIPLLTVMDSSNESMVIREAVAHVFNLLDAEDLFVAKHPVGPGLESQVQEVIRQLNKLQHPTGAVLFEISGDRGSGKTTLAKAIYNKIGCYFMAKCFLDIGWKGSRILSNTSKIREIESNTNGEELLKRGLVSQKRMLLVLDNNNMLNMNRYSDLWGERGEFFDENGSGESFEINKLKALLRSGKIMFGAGSIIITTARDSHLRSMLESRVVSHVYRVSELNYDESLELFSWYAFKQERPPDDNYVELARQVLSHHHSGCRLPLVVEILGSFLFSREKSEWKDVLEKLKGIYEDVSPFSVLRIIYDKLDPQVQSIFVEIASFYVGMNRNDVIHELNRSGYSAELGIAVLETNSFITFDEDNFLGMHSTLRDMGQAIIQSEFRGSAEEPKEYEVFLSFRGKDTRASFISHLYASLETAGLQVFKDDDEIQRGEQVSLSLLQAIRKSRIAIVVLSRNYANSRWCMIELESIMENCRTNRLVVVPVFYGVDPSDVRNQTGEFGKAFIQLIGKISINAKNKLETWKGDLFQVGGRAGFVLINSKNENEDIKKVVKGVIDLLGETDMFVAEHPVGVKSRVQELVTLLNCQQSNKVLLLGIWGMGGIGKTTIAKATYNQVRRNFEAKSFLLNVREVWEQNNGQVSLQQRLLSNVYKTTTIKIDTIDLGKMQLKKRLGQKKIFLVLDDVNKLEQLSALCGSRDWFGKGSRIIITTRDRDLLASLEVDHVYRIKEMDKDESLQLFSWHAFKQPNPREGFAELSRDVVKYSGGLPLPLQVIGSFLSTKQIRREWKSVLEKIKVIPNDEVLAKLRISFDGLSDDDVKEIFLDIAFFFIGMDRNDVMEILKDCGHFAEIGISILIRQSLLTIDDKNRIGMHDLLRDMGREIVRKKSPEVAKERSRLWLYNDILDALSTDAITTAVEGLTLKSATGDTPTYHFKTNGFEKLRRLRLLQLSGVKLDGDYKYLSTDLRWLCWHGFASRYTPLNFHQESLVSIELKYSNLQRVWKKSQMLNKLKFLNLSHSPNLGQTPDFSHLPNLEKLIMKDCQNLSSVSHTIGDLKKILLINLKDCTNLKTLPRSIYKLDSLKTLILSGCSKIEELEEDIEQMKALTVLVADRTAITRVPFAVVKSKSIGYVSLCGFEGLSRDVFPSIVWSWMSPTNSVLSLVQTSSTMSSLASLDEQDSCFHGLSSVINDLQKLQRIWVKCDSQVQLNQSVEWILNTLDTNREELEATPSTSSTFVDDGIQVIKTSSKKFLTSLLFRMGMNCHITSILRERILQKQPAIGPGVLPGDNYPYWLAFDGEGSSVSFEVPEVIGHDLKTIMCIAYFSSPDKNTSEGLQNVLVINYTKTTIQLYKRDGLASLEEEDEWQKLVSNIEPGDKVKVLIILANGFAVKETAVYFIYDDESIDEKLKHFPGDDETDNLTYTEFPYQASEVHDDLDFVLGETVITSKNARTPTLDILVKPSCKVTVSDELWETIESDDGESVLDEGDKVTKGMAKLRSASVKKKILEPLIQATKNYNNEVGMDDIATTSYVSGQYSILDCIEVLKTLKKGGLLNGRQFSFALELTKGSQNRVILMSLKDSTDDLVEWILYKYDFEGKSSSN